MKSIFSQRSTRRTAAVMLLVWLLALATGMANACLLPSPPVPHGHAATGPFAPTVAAQGTEAPPAQAQACEHEDAASHIKAACQNFCAAESLGLVNPQGAKTAPLADLPVLLARGKGLPVEMAASAAPRPIPGAPPGAQPPVAIRFLRLTI